jgi:hypothetical protein
VDSGERLGAERSPERTERHDALTPKEEPVIERRHLLAVVLTAVVAVLPNVARATCSTAPARRGMRAYYYVVHGFEDATLSAAGSADGAPAPYFWHHRDGTSAPVRASEAAECFVVYLPHAQTRVRIRVSYFGLYTPVDETRAVPADGEPGRAAASPAVVALTPLMHMAALIATSGPRAGYRIESLPPGSPEELIAAFQRVLVAELRWEPVSTREEILRGHVDALSPGGSDALDGYRDLLREELLDDGSSDAATPDWMAPLER